MKYRNPLPRRLDEIACCLATCVLLPLGFFFEMIIVLPTFHEPSTFSHTFTILMAMFLFLNIEGNLIACMLTDTSVDHKAAVPSDGDADRIEWRHCKACDKLSPPRSWHCNVCGVCILKRDHHCGFTGCCIGHKNHRYFLLFVIYLFVGSLYALAYNITYVALNDQILTCWLDTLTTRFPLYIESCSLWLTIQVSILVINIIEVIGVGSMLVFQVRMVLRGEVAAKRGNNPKYNCGAYSNLQSVFGQRMHVAWLFPLIESLLPEDGYSWKTKKPTEGLKEIRKVN